MNDFLILLQAKLDEAKSKENINANINKLQGKLNKLKLQAEIDPKSIARLTRQLEGILNQKIVINNKTAEYTATSVKTKNTSSAKNNKINKSNTFVSKSEPSDHDIDNDASNIPMENEQAKANEKSGQTWFHSYIDKIKSSPIFPNKNVITSNIISSFKKGISTVLELNTALVDLKKTTSMTASQLKDFNHSANDIAKQMGSTTKEVIEQASAWSKLGFNSEDTIAKMAKYSSMFKMISPGMDLNSATDGLANVMKSFNIGLKNPDEVTDGIISKINVVGTTQGLDNSDILEVLKHSSSAMAEANNSLEETIALGTAAVKIGKDATSVSDALKAISMRIRGYDEETKSYTKDMKELNREIAHFTKTASTPDGISLFTDDAKTEFKSTKVLFDDIAKIYQDLTANDQIGLLEVLAGNGQSEIISSIFNNYDIVKKSMESMANSAGNAEAEMSIAMDSIDYKLNQVKETGTGIAQNLFQQEDIKKVIDILLAFMEVIDRVTEKLDLFGTIMVSAGGFGIFNFVKNLDYQKVLKKFPRFFKWSNIDKKMIKWFKVQVYAFGSFKINQRGVIAGTAS
ncbi:MAG: phage tail tape measure protein [Lachnospiraceae bacterium]|nr:phage tail tape measure protein [Lachnospiraceae bacterium]